MSKTPIKKDSTLTVGKNYTQNIKENQITTVDVDKIVSVKGDCEIEVHKDFNVKVKQNVLQIIENNLNIKINKTNTIFVQNDVKQKYLKNLFQQIVKDYRLDVQENYQLKAKEIKTVVDNIELKSNNGISLRVGGNVLTVNPSGIHLNASLVDTTSGNCGVRVEESKNKKISNIGLKDDNE